VLANAKFCVGFVLEGLRLDDIPQRVDAVRDQAFEIEFSENLAVWELGQPATPWPAQKLATVMPGGNPFFRSRSFCGNRGTIAASPTAGSGGAATIGLAAPMSTTMPSVASIGLSVFMAMDPPDSKVIVEPLNYKTLATGLLFAGRGAISVNS